MRNVWARCCLQKEESCVLFTCVPFVLFSFQARSLTLSLSISISYGQFCFLLSLAFLCVLCFLSSSLCHLSPFTFSSHFYQLSLFSYLFSFLVCSSFTSTCAFNTELWPTLQFPCGISIILLPFLFSLCPSTSLFLLSLLFLVVFFKLHTLSLSSTSAPHPSYILSCKIFLEIYIKQQQYDSGSWENSERGPIE